MAQDEVIAKRYARGLAEHAVDAGDMKTVRADLHTVARILDPKAGDTYVPELAAYLESPLASADDKRKAVASLLTQAGVGKAVVDFLGVLIDRGRVRLLPKIAAAFGEVAGNLTGDRSVLVQTARPLTAEQEQRLADALSNACGGTVHIRQQVEPGLLAGAKVVMGDRTYDGTVLGKLEAMRRHLTAEHIFDDAIVQDQNS